MKIYLIKTYSGLVPYDDTDKESLKKIPLNVAMEYEVKIPRNLSFHKKFFAMLNLAFANQEEFKSFESFREAVIIGAGYYRTIQRLHGEEMILAKSIKFSSMDEAEFDSLYIAVLDTIIDYFNFTQEFVDELAKFY
jgi:hypothetical protein